MMSAYAPDPAATSQIKEVVCMNITMLEPLDVPREFLDAQLAALTRAGHTVLPCYEPLDTEEKARRIREAEALIIANGTLGAELLEQGSKLRYISVAFTGTDHLDKAACKRLGIRVSNASGYSTHDVAELTIALIISLLRGLKPADARVREGGTKQGLPAHRLHGKTVGILGTGAIGLQVARLLAAFGCHLLATSPTEHPEAHALGIRYVPLDELLQASDILTLHAPLNDKTRHLISRQKLALMKPEAFLINCARGAIVDTAALAEALNEGRLAGAAFDVFEMEPPIPADHPLLSARNMLLAPHIAFYTRESMKDRAVIAVENITKWLDGEVVREVRL